MKQVYLSEALALIGKTMPFIWIRLGSYLLLGLALGLYFAALGGVAWLLGSLWAPLGIIIFVIAAVGAWAIVSWASRYYFYLLKAAHTAVMTEFIVYGRGPEGSQVAYGKEQVTSRFRDTSIMFAVDQLVDGVVKAFTRTFVNITGMLPIPGIDTLGSIVRRVALAATTFVDESILSRAYKQREENIWKVAHDGVVLYAQAWKPILTNAVVLALLSFVEFVVLLIVLGLPAAAIGALVPGLRIALGLGVIIGAWMIKLAVADAFSLAATLIAYHRATEGLEPNAEWTAKLENLSDKFRELGRKATEAVSPTPTSSSDSTQENPPASTPATTPVPNP